MQNDFHSRQSFLGPQLPELVERVRICIVGVSGGGSHIVQQSAHVGFRNYALYDPEVIGEENLHRHVGATREDVEERRPKVEIGKRIIKSLWPDSSVEAIQHRWQDDVDHLRRSDIIFGCIDGFRARLDLEAAARRYVIPLIDIGLGITRVEKRMGGQVALSMPGAPCFRCMSVITDRELEEEAARSGSYPGFGPNPQVVWANGVLASSAIGVALDLLTGWSPRIRPAPFLSYDGNECTLRVRPFSTSIKCPHFPPTQVGEPSPARISEARQL